MTNVREKRNARPFSRRRLLGAVGGGAVAVGAQGAIGVATAGADGRPAASTPPGRFGRIFPDLPPFYDEDDDDRDQLTEALLELGKPDGILDAKDQLDKGPVALIVDPTRASTTATTRTTRPARPSWASSWTTT